MRSRVSNCSLTSPFAVSPRVKDYRIGSLADEVPLAGILWAFLSLCENSPAPAVLYLLFLMLSESGML